MALAPEHLRFAVIATDTCLFTIRKGALWVRLIKVTRPPHFPNDPGLPGGLIDPKETAEEAAVRHLESKAHISKAHVHVEQLATMSELNRDPRGRVVAVAYLALIPWEQLSHEEQSDSEQAWWSPVSKAKKLAYDHDEILSIARKRLASKAAYTTIMQALMPKEFTLPELEVAYAAVLGETLDRRNFRKKLKKLNILEQLPGKRITGAHRPALLYKFRKKKIEEIEVI